MQAVKNAKTEKRHIAKRIIFFFILTSRLLFDYKRIYICVAEFERKAHDLYAAGQPLTASALNKVYHDLEATYYDGIGIDADIDPEWSYVPHFYRAFYVYQYATGFSSAVAIAEHILTTGDASGYLKFLTTGGSDYPLEELKIAGIDLTKPDTVRSALRVFDETVDELSALLL